MEYENKSWIWGLIIVALFVGFFGGQWYGKRAEMRRTEQTIKELQTSLNIFVPPLPDIVNAIGGKIVATNSDAFVIEIPSMSDRYPKPGVPMATEKKTIHIAKDTKITSINFDLKTFKNGLPQTKTISADDLKAGDVVSVTVKENARTGQNLTAVSINRSSGI